MRQEISMHVESLKNTMTNFIDLRFMERSSQDLAEVSLYLRSHRTFT